MGTSTVIRSELIATLEEARDYYGDRFVGRHTIPCAGRPVDIVFERDASHLYSREPAAPRSVPADLRVDRHLGGGTIETREFCRARARLMDQVLRAISLFTVSIPGTGRTGYEKRMLHGPPLPDGRHMRVILRPGPGAAWTCVSAYDVSRDEWLRACRAKRAKFPP